MATQNLHFVKTALERITPPVQKSSYDTYKDQKEAGLILVASSGGTKTFYLYRKINGRPERVKLGRFPDMSIENARKAAQREKGKIVGGINPNEEKRQLSQEMTLNELFEMYMERYSRKYKKSWRYDEREIPQRVGDWFKRKLSAISQQDIRKRMEIVHDTSGPIAANHFLQRIKSMFNKAIEWGWAGKNPAVGIKQYKKTARDRFLQPDELPRFFKALMAERAFNPVAADYILLSLLTGAGKSNVLAMRWQDVNLNQGTWRIPETKNGEPQTVILSKQALAVLQKRRESASGDCEWVFPSPSPKSRQGHLYDPKKSWQRVLEAAEIEDLRIHDLRRTFGSYQAVTGANSYIIQKALGHKDQQSTAIYARLNLDPVRASVQTANDVMLESLTKIESVGE